MNLHRHLTARAAVGNPVRVGLIGAGKFGTMFLAQARFTTGMHIAGIADLEGARARAALATAGWPVERGEAHGMAEAVKTGATWITEDATALIAADGIEVIIDATRRPASATR